MTSPPSPSTTGRWLSPHEQRRRARRRARTLAIVLVLLLITTLFDRWAFHALYSPESAAAYERREWYQMLRIVGYFPTWIIIGAAFLLHAMGPTIIRRPGPRDPRIPRWIWWPGFLVWPANWNGLWIVLGAGVAGIVGDFSKPLFGRLRPTQTNGFYRFYGLPDDPASNAAYGLPSSHAAVAFGAAFMIWFLYPRAGLVVLLAAAGCGLTRLLTGAHFVSDVFVSALIAYAMTRMIRPRARAGDHRLA